MNRILSAGIGAALALALSASLALGAMDGNSNSSSSEPLRASDSGLGQAADLIAAERYDEALTVLAGVIQRNPRNADAYNYLGYSNRKLGRFDEALGYYQQALGIDDRHLGALQYLGELYLDMGDLAKAEEQLAAIDDICWLGCEEERDLEAQVAAYKAQLTN
jgi:tetratricopeptide (TPR) repeat protein